MAVLPQQSNKFCLLLQRIILNGLFICFAAHFLTFIYMQLIQKYFPNLTPQQTERFAQLDALYRDWNTKINVISRKDIDNLYPHHVLHSLGIAKVINFRPDTEIMDIGTGGGFPGIPLAIMFPECRFYLIDSIGKKVRVAQAVAEALGLENVTAVHRNVIEEKGKFDFVVSRAVMDINELIPLVRRLVKRQCINAMPNGLICLKGGNLEGELHKVKSQALVEELSSYFNEEFFATKKVIYLPL